MNILVDEPAIVTRGILITIGRGNILQVSDFLLKFLGLLVVLSQQLLLPLELLDADDGVDDLLLVALSIHNILVQSALVDLPLHILK